MHVHLQSLDDHSSILAVTINKYPELRQFLNANTPEERQQLAEKLKSSYDIAYESKGSKAIHTKTLSPIELIAAIGYTEHFKVLAVSKHFFQKDYQSRPLRYAAENGHLDILNFILENKRNYHGASDFNNYALRRAFVNGHTSVTDRLQQVVWPAFSNFYSRYLRLPNDSAIRAEFLAKLDAIPGFKWDKSAEYDSVIRKFMMEKLVSVKAAYELSHPGTIFDIADSNLVAIYSKMFDFFFDGSFLQAIDSIIALLGVPVIRERKHSQGLDNLQRTLGRLNSDNLHADFERVRAQFNITSFKYLANAYDAVRDRDDKPAFLKRLDQIPDFQWDFFTNDRFFLKFMLKKLTHLKSAHTQSSSNEVFDIQDANLVKIYRSILSALVKEKNILEYVDEIFSLFKIPAIFDNMLLREFFLKIHSFQNSAATDRLSRILCRDPVFRGELLQQNLFVTSTSSFDRNHGSWQGAGSIYSKKESLLMGKYKHMVDSPAAQANALEALRVALLARYHRKPAIHVNEDGKQTTLPASMEKFTQSSLTPTEQQFAVMQYYQHEVHTALRYLVEQDLSLKKNITSSTLVAILWTALNDRNVPACDGFTIESRVEFFIRLLAMIQRRFNKNTITDKNGYFIESDDKREDSPNCYEQTRYQLLDGFVGYPLVQQLNATDVNIELVHFVKACMKKRMGSPEQRERYLQAFLGEAGADKVILRELNLSADECQQFIALMKERYGAQFSGRLKKYASWRLDLPDESIGQCHAIQFGGKHEVDLQDLLSNPNLDDVNDDINTFVKDHFVKAITTDTKRQECLEALTDSYKVDRSALLSLDINVEQQTAFMDSLTRKYGTQLDKRLQDHVRARFHRHDNELTGCHALRFADEINLEDILNKPVTSVVQPGLSMFAQPVQRAEHDAHPQASLVEGMSP